MSLPQGYGNRGAQGYVMPHLYPAFGQQPIVSPPWMTGFPGGLPYNPYSTGLPQMNLGNTAVSSPPHSTGNAPTSSNQASKFGEHEFFGARTTGGSDGGVALEDQLGHMKLSPSF